MAYTKEDFDNWIFFISDKMDYFTNEFANENNLCLDYSIDSLNALEDWLPKKYEKISEIIEDKTLYNNTYNILDLCGVYVGEVFRKHIGGKWYMIMDNPKNVYYKLPVLTDPSYIGETYKCPITMVTACLDRRRGDYISWILNNNIENMKR